MKRAIKNFLARQLIALLVPLLRSRGYSAHFAPILLHEIILDIFNNNNFSLEQKIWAYKRGFLSSKIKSYGLTEANYRSFLSDFDDYKLFPMNGQFSQWINDKLTTKYVLSPFNEYLPKYYYYVNGDSIIPLMDSNSIFSMTDEIIDLLKCEKSLAVKLVAGSCGIGFYKLSYLDGLFYINGNAVNKVAIDELLRSLRNYLITECLTAHEEIRRVYRQSPNTLRMMVIKEQGKSAIVANAFMRFGTSQTGVVDNATAGAIFCIVDVATGRFHDAKRKVGHEIIRCDIHPDTQVRVEGVLPHWELIKSKVLEIANYMPLLNYMGFDVVITQNGFKILEINSHQDVKWFQYYYPLLRDNLAASYFTTRLREMNK